MSLSKNEQMSLNIFIIMGFLLLISICVGITSYNISENHRLANMCGPNAFAVERSAQTSVGGTWYFWECAPKP